MPQSGLSMKFLAFPPGQVRRRDESDQHAGSTDPEDAILQRNFRGVAPAPRMSASAGVTWVG